MKKQICFLSMFTALVLLNIGCNNGSSGGDGSSDGNSNSVTGIYLPYLTAANTTSGTNTYLTLATDSFSFGQPHSETDCVDQNSGGCYIASFVFNGTQKLLNATKIIDVKSCNLNVIISNKLVSTGTNLTQLYKIEAGSTFLKLKTTSTFDGTTVKAIKSYICTGTNATNYAQIQYTNYQLTDGTSNLEVVGSNSDEHYRLSGEGVFANNSWSSKKINFKRIDGTNTTVHSQLTQYSDMIDINLAYRNPYSNLSTSVVQLFGRYTLSGISASSYGMGQGTVKANVSGMGENILSWGATDTGLVDATSSIHSNNIGTQTYLAEAVNSDVAISTSESWNCEVTADESFNDLSANLSVLQNFQSCTSAF